MTNCTVSGNASITRNPGYVGGALFITGGTATLTNTLVAGNIRGDLAGSVTPTITTSLIGGDPQLAPLGDYGGATQTMALLPGSPAINAGTSGAGIPTTDQRGKSRVGGNDIGAFEISLATIAVSPANPSVAKGLTQQFTATGTYEDNTTQDLTSQVTWASATTSVATITSGGLATGVNTGTSTISATLSGVTGSTVLTVTAAALQSINVTPASPSVAKGLTRQFAATGTYSDNSTQDLTSQVTWASATTSVATITSGGLATGVNTGTSTISATLSGVTGSTVLTVTAPEQATVSSTAVLWGTAGNSGALVTQADGLRLLPAGRTIDMPWMGINRIAITLGSAASLTPGDVSVVGSTGGNYGPVTISGSGTNFTITFAKPITNSDRVTVTIANAGIATFTRRLDVLPGDVTDDGVVDIRDSAAIRNQIFEIVPLTLLGDLDGNGVVDIADYNLAKAKVNTRLP